MVVAYILHPRVKSHFDPKNQFKFNLRLSLSQFFVTTKGSLIRNLRMY